jgi:hypothetical protein
MKSFVEQIEISQARASIDFFRVEINQYIAEAVEKAIIGNADIKTVLNEAADKSNKLLRSVNKK